VSKRRDSEAARQFFRRALAALKVRPSEVVTDKAPTYPRVLDELVPAAWHHVERYENNRIEADHGRLTRKSVSEWAGGSARRSAAEPGCGGGVSCGGG
jgi:transposase-like protein